MLNMSYLLDSKLGKHVSFIHNDDTVTLELRENALPNYIEYIVKSQTILVQRNISEEKYNILKSVLGYHFNIDVIEYNMDNIKVTLHGLIKYKIPLLNLVHNFNQLKLIKSQSCVQLGDNTDYIMVSAEIQKPRNHPESFTTHVNIVKSICGIDRITAIRAMITHNYDNSIIITVKN